MLHCWHRHSQPLRTLVAPVTFNSLFPYLSIADLWSLCIDHLFCIHSALCVPAPIFQTQIFMVFQIDHSANLQMSSCPSVYSYLLIHFKNWFSLIKNYISFRIVVAKYQTGAISARPFVSKSWSQSFVVKKAWRWPMVGMCGRLLIWHRPVGREGKSEPEVGLTQKTVPNDIFLLPLPQSMGVGFSMERWRK